MLKNNNQSAVRRISSRSLRYNRVRNMFTVLAIVLTTFMFTAVFGVGASLAKNLNVMSLRQQGTRASVFLPNPTSEQTASTKKCKHLNAAGIRIHAADAQSPSDENAALTLDYYDETEYEENFLPAVSDVKGSYPEGKDEIMCSKSALDSLGVTEPRIGMDITVTVGGEEKVFKLSGEFTDYGFDPNGFRCFVSESYCAEEGLTAEKDGRLSMSAKTGSQDELIEELENSLELKDGQEIVSEYDVQHEFFSNYSVTAAAVLLIGLIIIISGYLLIYNVMYISVTKDIRFYGMLKTIGASPKQIKKIVKSQSFRLSLIGIPVGIALGSVTLFAVVPYAMKMFSAGRGAMPTDISFNPLIYVGTVLFGILTVAVSCRKPAKLAAKVSPVEAVKYNGQDSNKIKPHKSTSGGRLYKMAFRNVFREKKRALLVFASLFMGSMAFLSTNAYLGSMKLENYVDYYLPNDCTIYTGNSDEENEKKNNEAAEKLAEEIAAVDGVTNVSVTRATEAELDFDEELFKPFLERKINDDLDDEYMRTVIEHYKLEGEYCAPVIGVDSEMIELYNQKARQKIDLERFEKGEVCFVGYVDTEEQSDSLKGKTITVTDTKTKNSVSLEVGACPTEDEYRGRINIGYYWEMVGAPSCILVSQSVIDNLTGEPSTDSIIIDCDPKAESYVSSEIKELIKTNPSVTDYKIKSEAIADFKSSMMTMNILTAGISIILILIGVINFINVMLTGVFARKKELAVMESVGMTKKQVRKMLMLEGVYYGAVSLALILTVGNVIVFIVAKLAEMTANYAVFNYPWRLMIAVAAVIMLICVTVPAAVYGTISKESVTERLRDTD